MSNASTTATGSSASSQYKCKICDIAFGDNALQRAHAKSEWHIYNLKRSLTSLPAISFQIYNARVASNQETTATDDSENAAYHQSCAACQKHYYTPKSYTNHLKSASHVQAVAKLETQAESSEATGLETIASQTDSLGTFACLFCPRPFSSLDLSLTHMEKSHGFAIPQQEFLFDLPSFIDYLATLITTFQECLYCGQSRDSVSAIKQHMNDQGHCSLAPDAAESSEFEDFYDTPEVASDEEDSEGGKPAVNITILPLQSDARKLRLPSGRTLGHRSGARYFRQSHSAAKTSPQETLTADANEASRSKPSDRREIMSRKRSENANRGIIGISDLEKRAVRTLEKKMMKVEVRARNQYQARVERAANKQKFFKPDVPGPLNG